MKDIRLIQGRLSNQMFILAAHLSWCWDNNVHFFVQDEKYFKKYEPQIRQLYGDGIDQRNKGYVGIHVRLAKNPINPDEPAYSENPFYENISHHLHEDLTANYYWRALAYFNGMGYKFKVFSDDIEQCKKHPAFQADDIEFVEGGTDISDMNEMASCEHNIIANSSFSWWAAWLNPNPDKIVIAPAKWFSNPEDDKKFIGIPSTWIRL